MEPPRQYRLIFDPKETTNNCIECGQEIEVEFSRCNVCEWDYICSCIEYEKQKHK
jgi:hypothetical protein